MIACGREHLSYRSFAASFLAALAALGAHRVCLAGPTEGESLFSSIVSQRFCELGYELAATDQPGTAEIEQALTFFTAAGKLDPTARHVVPEMLRLTARHPEEDYSETVLPLLLDYADRTTDLGTATQAVSYLLGQLNSREEREQLLQELLAHFSGRNEMLASEIAAKLGLLMAEKADTEDAKYYFVLAYNNSKYNDVAFAKLTELSPELIQPPVYLDRMRAAIRRNPLDLESALAFAEHAERLQLYDTAAESYRYCAAVFRFLRPSQPLPASIYLPWAISCYNSQRYQHTCLQIAGQVAQSGRFDLLLEAISGKAAAKIGNEEQAAQMLQAAEEKAQRILIGGAADGLRKPSSPDLELYRNTMLQLVWFYCFVTPQSDKALELANRAYSSDPNSTHAASLLAYTLAVKGQGDAAQLLVDNYKRNQIAELAQAKIQLSKGKKDVAAELLKAAITKDPGSLAAEQAKALLKEIGSEYVPAVDPALVLTVLRNEIGERVVPEFVAPEKMVSAQLNLRGNKFAYGSDFEAAVVVRNDSEEPLIISKKGLFKGNIRIDGKVSGDIEQNIPNLVSLVIEPSAPLEPGKSLSIPVRLVVGRLRQILLTYPQASINVEFSLFLDPVVAADGSVKSEFAEIEQPAAVVGRSAVELTSRYMQNRVEALSKGRQGQRTKTGQLFAGLLKEQLAFAGTEPLYKLAYADWMPELLRSALVSNLTDDDWKVRVHTMVDVLSLPLDYEMTEAVSENLRHTRWPCRLMAGFLLGKSQDESFRAVLDWTARHDTHPLVRRMAVALGGKEPEEAQAPTQGMGNQGAPNERLDELMHRTDSQKPVP